MTDSLGVSPRQIAGFSLGAIVVDRRSSRKLTSEDIIPALGRHINGDWGRINRQHKRANQAALCRNKPIKSIYFTSNGVKFCVVTNGQRTATIVKVLQA